MFADEIRRTAEAAPRAALPEISTLLWRAFAAGQVTEEEAEALSGLIEARKVRPAPAAAPPRRSVGARPRTPDSLARRRRWAASGALPPQLAARFTLAEVAVLAVVAGQVSRHGRCTLTLDHIAALAGVSRTSVRNALREARAVGVLTVEERRLTAWRSAPNVIRIICPGWKAWQARGGGRKSASPTNTKDQNKNRERQAEGKKGASEERQAEPWREKARHLRFAPRP